MIDEKSRVLKGVFLSSFIFTALLTMVALPLILKYIKKREE
jgi:hypothetical protein